MKHVNTYFSDHCMLVLDTKPEGITKRKQFYFDERWLGKPGVEEVIESAWTTDCIGSPMFQVAFKIKRCRMALLQWNTLAGNNSAKKI